MIAKLNGRPCRQIVKMQLMRSGPQTTGGFMYRGTVAVPFSELFADTLSAFGVAGAWECYSKRMSRAEFRFWVRSTLGI